MSGTGTRPLRVLTWHIHGSYMTYLTHVPVEWYLPVRPGGGDGYGGRWPEWPDNVHEVPIDDVPSLDLDCILFQSRANWDDDQWRILSAEQRRLPRVYLEHDPPREHPTDTRHPCDDPNVLLVHVTAFNDLMWDSGRTPTKVIEHGVTIPDGVRYTGELERGIVVINNIATRGRRLGSDVFERARAEVPLDLVGMGFDAVDGLGEVRLPELPAFEARYRFFFNPIRYTSLGLAVCEAMLVGMPIVALATTEMTTVVENGVSGFASTSVPPLIDVMQQLLRDPGEAKRLGDGARRVAQERFGIDRFGRDWLETFRSVAGVPRSTGSGERAVPVAAGEGRT